MSGAASVSFVFFSVVFYICLLVYCFRLLLLAGDGAAGASAGLLLVFLLVGFLFTWW
jgi:hypothetical protein